MSVENLHFLQTPSDVYGADYAVYLKRKAWQNLRYKVPWCKRGWKRVNQKCGNKISVLKKVVFFLKSNQQGLKRWVNERRT